MAKPIMARHCRMAVTTTTLSFKHRGFRRRLPSFEVQGIANGDVAQRCGGLTLGCQ